MRYRRPNLIIVGCQKCGTTWLHSTLGKSPQIFASKVKELNYFNQRNFTDLKDSYVQNFPETPGKRYYVESTPHYFQKPSTHSDIAANISSFTTNPKIIVIFRNPVDRYESAYIHHMMKGRIPYSTWIDKMNDDNKMLTLGKYSEILPHWLKIFPDMGIFFYDDITDDPNAFIGSVMDFLQIDNDITPSDVLFRTNDKRRKAAKLGDEWTRMPKMTSRLRTRLLSYYHPDILALQKMTARDLSAWL